MRNFEIAWALREIADLMEFGGEDYFKVRAYRRAAKVLAGLSDPAEEMYKNGTLLKVPGVGKNILSKIGELVETGSCDLLSRLRQEIPRGILQVMAVPGLGPKRARLFYERLGVTTVEELEKAAREKRIRSVPGVGSKREQEILRSIRMLKAGAGSFLLSTAREVAGELTGFFRKLPEVDNVAVTGSFRRRRETVRDVDLLVGTESPGEVFEAAEKHPLVARVLERNGKRMVVMTRWNVPAEITAVVPGAFFPALLWSTGNERHREGLRELAGEYGIRLDPTGVYDRRGEEVAVRSEEDIYGQLGLPFISPEMRGGRGEIALARAGKLPAPVREDQIRGDLHVHSNWSDGGNSIEELVSRAREKGYGYIAVTDHSQSLKVARGLSVDRLQQQWEYIRALNEELTDFHVFTGIEVDILGSGELDYPDEILAAADVVIASVHSGFRQSKEKITRRILRAVNNPHVDIIGHLTGRLLGHREGYAVDVEEVIKGAAESDTALEINSSPDRLDLNEENVRLAARYGVKLAVNTDAHDLRRLEEMNYGLAVARRAWLGAGDILNAMEAEDLATYLGIKNG